MRPQPHDDSVKIPITFDARGGRTNGSSKGGWIVLVTSAWLIMCVIVFFASQSIFRWIFPFISFFFLTYIFRFLILRERFYRAKRQELIENDYVFNYNVFWNIYEINNSTPNICYFGNGLKAIFVAFDKDVIIGRPTDNEYYHHEAIANAYQQLAKRGIEAIHIDYMDTLGKDKRMQKLFEDAENTENPELRKLLIRKYDYMETEMNHSYASYDVYAFYSNQRDDIFWDELQLIIQQFKQANYLRARTLNRDDISELVETLMNIDNFSINQANDNMFVEMNTERSYLRVIWTESNGEKTQINKTLDEVKETNRIKKVEKEMRKGKIKDKLFKKPTEEDTKEVDLFGDD